jgi:hypothetical protein
MRRASANRRRNDALSSEAPPYRRRARPPTDHPDSSPQLNPPPSPSATAFRSARVFPSPPPRTSDFLPTCQVRDTSSPSQTKKAQRAPFKLCFG